MINFASFFKKNGDSRRHMRNQSHRPRKFSRFVPKVHQIDPSENQKYIKIKNNISKREVLSSIDLHQLMKKYHFKVNLKEPVVIDSRNGIMVTYENGKFILKRK